MVRTNNKSTCIHLIYKSPKNYTQTTCFPVSPCNLCTPGLTIGEGDCSTSSIHPSLSLPQIFLNVDTAPFSWVNTITHCDPSPAFFCEDTTVNAPPPLKFCEEPGGECSSTRKRAYFCTGSTPSSKRHRSCPPSSSATTTPINSKSRVVSFRVATTSLMEHITQVCCAFQLKRFENQPLNSPTAGDGEVSATGEPGVVGELCAKRRSWLPGRSMVSAINQLCALVIKIKEYCYSTRKTYPDSFSPSPAPHLALQTARPSSVRPFPLSPFPSSHPNARHAAPLRHWPQGEERSSQENIHARVLAPLREVVGSAACREGNLP